ncbi:MAG TPA: hypothetical protein PLU47_05045 [Azonexus sp.]|nr:hypothetical protein [Azonexus sp.]
MADPLKIIRRLEAVTTDYAVFERDQVLTHDQLNSIAEYLDDQGRLTRTQLLGVGIVGGLLPALGKGQISIGKGVGVTSDGDLLGLSAETIFDRWLPYDESAPAYEPFYVDGNMLPLIEVLATDDPRPGQPLAELGDRLGAMVAIAFMESYENDPDLCTGGDCDNRGRTARNILRFMLLEREMAEKTGLNVSFETMASYAARMPRLAAVRPVLGSEINNAESFVAAYRQATEITLEALNTAWQWLPWWNLGGPEQKRLLKIMNSLAGIGAGIQYCYAFAQDLVATWSDLREAMFADKAVPCPGSAAFPKHLLLGALADPAQLRTGHYTAPWEFAGTGHERVSYLMSKLDALIKGFALPGDSERPKIVPSRRETAPLEQRAVPIYYGRDSEVRKLWGEARWQRGESDDNCGYHWMPPIDKQPELSDPFVFDVGRNDFFRIEGHLGMKADDAEPAIEKLVRQRNLPIAVMSVLLHNRRDLVIRGPKFKKTSLHSLHYLLRQDLASHLKDNIAFSTRMITDIKAAGTAVQKPAGNVLNADLVKQVEGAKAKLQMTETDLVGSADKPGPLGIRSYKSFSLQNSEWTARFDDAVVTTSKAKAGLGDIMRTDLISPVDAVSGSKSHLWVNWLGDILKKRDDDKKDRLLFTNMIADHPGLEHAGGAAPGGTFVLAYDDSGVVIGDLALPYWIDDIDESDKDEPQLTFPDIRVRLPDDLLPIKVIKPLELSLDDFKLTKILPELKMQENYSKFFRESLGSLGDVLKNTSVKAAAGGKYATGDLLLDRLLADVDSKKEQVQGLRDIRNDDRLSAASRVKVEEQIKRLEGELADAVSATTQHFAVDAAETVRAGADKTVIYQTIGQGINAVADKEVSTKLQSNLKETANAAARVDSGTAAVVANQVMINAGFRIG